MTTDVGTSGPGPGTGVGRRGRVRVVGAGVIGLTTARELHDDGWTVDVVAAEPPLATTSAVAAAFWYPYLVGPADAVRRWGAVARQRFDELADDPDVPVVRRTVHERFRRDGVDPDWRTTMPDAARENVAHPFTDGWRYTSWVADMPRYLGWLVDDLRARDVVIRQVSLTDLSEASTPAVDLVVDCAGVGARTLVPDDLVDGVGGQVVLVRCPQIQGVWLDVDHPAGPTYVVPRGDTVVIGGTSVPGTPHDAVPDPDVARAILARATALVPSLADAAVIGHALGRRPARPDVRLELEQRPWGVVLHHYGHGGAGMTLSWGSAADAVELARSV